MSTLFVVLAAIGGLLLVLGLLSGLIHESGFLSEPLFALLEERADRAGVFDLLDFARLGEEETILEGASLVTLGVAPLTHWRHKIPAKLRDKAFRYTLCARYPPGSEKASGSLLNGRILFTGIGTT